MHRHRRGCDSDARTGCADDILIQVAAVKAALNHFASTLVETEMKACVEACMPGDVDERRGRVTKALAALLKS